ncbi:ubiquitin-specific protease doa4 [Coemansia aciculifera]|uniref:ubiquitinyl hydrolase 1 n=1 Tax=Coemansia aciculifera TaxID=417176 RepID=A0A9W8M834_9FUNG|nr:ubiquitin-specific protease doa4 [Coemansia aciculifera]KAJ2877165.1 ubiquitin-specific protease doa4 [Coemansia aciculifera]
MSRLGDGGRTSDLIRRFESLALERTTSVGDTAPPKPAPKPPMLTKRTPVANDGIWPRQDAQMHSDSLGTPTTASSRAQPPEQVSEPVREPRLAPVPPKSADYGSSSSPTQDLLSVSNSVYTATTGNTPRSTTSARKQSLSGSRSRSTTVSSASPPTTTAAAAAAAHALATTSHDATNSRRKSRLTELNQLSAINTSVQVSSKSLLRNAKRRVDEARLSQISGDIENAYVGFMTASRILDLLPKQRDFETVSQDPKYVQLRSDFRTTIIYDMERLSAELKKWPCTEPSTVVVNQNLGISSEIVGQAESEFARAYPEVPLNAADAAKSSTLQQSSSAQESPWLAMQMNDFNEIDAQARVIDASAKVQARGMQGVSIVSSSGSSNRVAMAISPQLPKSSEITPANVEFVDSNTTTCTPTELLGLFDRSRSGGNGRPTVLVLDVRPYQDYMWGRIDHRYTVNVDPIGLQKKYTSTEIESSLAIVADEQQRWFRRRDEFDLIVYVCQSARSFGDSGSTEVSAIEFLNSAIYHYEYQKPLKHPPLFLIGGFDGWVQAVGRERCVWSEEARRAMDAVPLSTSKLQWGYTNSASGSVAPDASSMLAYHASTGSVSSMHQLTPYQPTVAAYNRNNGVVAAGSVFDFFQQSNAYQQQYQQHQQHYQQQQVYQHQQQQQLSTAGRLPSAHTSYTQGYNASMSPSGAYTAVTETSVAQNVTVSQGVVPDTVQLEAAYSSLESDMTPKPLPHIPNRYSNVQRRKTIFDNPIYGFTGSTHVSQPVDEYPVVSSMQPPPAYTEVAEQHQPEHQPKKRRDPPPVPQARLPPKPAAYIQEQEQMTSAMHASAVSAPAPAPEPAPVQQLPLKPTMPTQPLPPRPPPTVTVRPPSPSISRKQLQQEQRQLYHVPSGQGFYHHPVAAGSDPSLNGRMHAGGHLRNSTAYDHQAQMMVASGAVGYPFMDSPGVGATNNELLTPSSRNPLSLDSASYGATGLKNFGNTCFMNCVIQCLVGTAPFSRYFLQGGWKKDLVRDNSKNGKSDVVVEFARLVHNMWRGQYGSLSPIAFRSAVGSCSAQFKGNDQEDAQEFASFILDTLHESMNRVHPRPPPERDLTPEEEFTFERMSDMQQADVQWGRYIRRNWSIMTSIFQGQVQSRLTCLSCKHTSTTYFTFTELSVPIPSYSGNGGKSATSLVRKSSLGRNHAPPVSIYQCLDAYSEVEVLEGDNKWQCPRCQTKRRASKRLLISRLPLVLIVHLKRFSTIGHFREKLETDVQFPTQNLNMENYVMPGVSKVAPTGYNLYAVANHFGTLSGGHYTASVFNGHRGQWNYFDDTRVSPVPEQKVASPAAYLLFFVQNQA